MTDRLDNSEKNDAKTPDTENYEIKQNFLASAIEDISSYIHLADTKVSIIMGAITAFLLGFITFYDKIRDKITPLMTEKLGEILCFAGLLIALVCIIVSILCGILTLRPHTCNIKYDTNWFINLKKYDFPKFKSEVQIMNNDKIIDDMAAELYKLNNINIQKHKTLKWSLRAFSILVVEIMIVSAYFIVNILLEAIKWKPKI